MRGKGEIMELNKIYEASQIALLKHFIDLIDKDRLTPNDLGLCVLLLDNSNVNVDYKFKNKNKKLECEVTNSNIIESLYYKLHLNLLSMLLNKAEVGTIDPKESKCLINLMKLSNVNINYSTVDKDEKNKAYFKDFTEDFLFSVSDNYAN